MKNCDGLPLKDSFALASSSAFFLSASSSAYVFCFFFFEFAISKSIGASSSSMIAFGSFGLKAFTFDAVKGFEPAAAANGFALAAVAKGFEAAAGLALAVWTMGAGNC